MTTCSRCNASCVHPCASSGICTIGEILRAGWPEFFKTEKPSLEPDATAEQLSLFEVTLTPHPEKGVGFQARN
jgi:hypothetical protein